MSNNLVPADRWDQSISQASIPANNNARRFDLSQVPVISLSTTAQPSDGSSSDMDCYIIPAGATGSQWVLAEENDLAIFYAGTWTFFAPINGQSKYVEGEDDNYQFKADSGVGSWSVLSGGGGIASVVAGSGISVDDTDPANPIVSAIPGGGGLDIIVEPTAITADRVDHSGLERLIIAGGDITFDSAQSYATNDVFNFRASADLDLIEDGVTLDPPAGGTLSLQAGMAVTIAMLDATNGVIIGQTVPA